MTYFRSVLALFLCLPWSFAYALSLNVELTGVKGELLDNAKAFLDIYNETKNPDSLNPTRIQQLHKKAPEQIKRAIQPFGYYQAKITKKLDNIDDTWTASYQIEPGPPIRLSAVDIFLSGEGETNEAFVQLVKRFPLKQGDVLLHSKYEDFKQQLRKSALTYGFLEAKYITSEVRVDLEKYTAQIVIIYDTGSQYRFGKVRFTQIGEQLNEQFLQRYIFFKEGDPYSTEQLLQLQTALSDSDHFARIEINQLFEEVNDLKVPLEILVTPRLPRKYKFGVGYGTDSGARASAEHQRRVSPKGHVLTLKAKVSERINRVDMQYMMPLRKPASEQFTMTTHYVEQTTESRLTKAYALDFRRSTGVRNWRQAVAITYEREDYEVSDDEGSSQLLMPNIDWLRSVFNNRIYPTEGSRLTAEIWTSHTVWLSDVNFIQLKLTGKWIFPLSENGRLLMRLDTGGTLVKSIDELPASKRFYAGGDQSIRGYGYEELGPLDSAGDTLGGKYLGVGSVEYEYRFLANWGAAVFYDAGNGFNDFKEKIYRGVGTGIRWRSIVGPIRLDLGWPLDKTVKFPRIHLIIGLDL